MWPKWWHAMGGVRTIRWSTPTGLTSDDDDDDDDEGCL